MSISSRISIFAENQNISIRFLERKIGCSSGVVAKSIANGTDIQAKWIALIVDNFPQLSADWLLTGEGEMLRSTSLPKEEVADEGALVTALRELLTAKDQIIAEKEKQVRLLEKQLKTAEELKEGVFKR